MNYRNLADLSVAVASWSDRLPWSISLVVGVPRSGLLAASVFALHRNIPLISLPEFLAGSTPHGGERLKLSQMDVSSGEILIIDDSVSSGMQITKVRAQLAGHKYESRIIYGAVFASAQGRAFVDTFAELVETPRVFQWNIFHHNYCARMLLDLDGVLCRDPSDDENDDGSKYLEFLESVPVRVKPSLPLCGIVSARLEKYRKPTEAWLKRAGINYGKLHLLDLPDAATRQRMNCHATHKAKIYASSSALLFIESDSQQAEAIARMTSRYVLCTDNQAMYGPKGLSRVITQIHVRLYGRIHWLGRLIGVVRRKLKI